MDNIFNKTNCFKINEKVKSILLFGKYEDVPNPVISIIMPVYKRPDTFKKSLDSALKQDFDQPYEIVVVDNYDGEGESPNLKVVINSGDTKIMYYHNEKNLGMLGNWNRGIEMSRAEFITFCHDDDILLPSCLSRLMGLQKKVGRKCILSVMNEIDDNDNIISRYDYPHNKWWFIKERDYINYTLYDQFLGSQGFGVGCLFNRKCMLELGGYNNQFYPSADYALHSAYTYYYGCILNKIPTFNYRIAVNESLNQYKKFIEVDKFFRQCMAPKINLPNYILKLIIEAKYNISKIQLAIKWGGEKNNIIKEIKITDKIIWKFATLWLDIKSYKFLL